MPNANYIFTKSLTLKVILLATIFIFIYSSCEEKIIDTAIMEKILMDSISIPEGFVIEKLYTPSDNCQGSWVSITKDDKGHFYTSDQFGKIYKVTVPGPDNNLDSIDVEMLDLHIGLAQGLLWHRNVLYASVNSNVDKHLNIQSGFYKITDSSGNGDFDTVDTIRSFSGRHGEHGPHNIVLSPDEESLFIVYGNFVEIPEEAKSRVPKVWGDDNLLPIIKDPNGHANHLTAPGGWVVETDLNFENWTIYSVGMRNTYDIAFNQDGELFGFDSDMEYDIGMPWYRQIRLNHLTSGAEFGWRTGTGKFSEEYPDNLPGIAKLGQGSPTGLMNGEGLAFPKYYQDGLFLFDWSYGTMYFTRLTPDGSTYKTAMEEFLSGVPLPLTNGIAGDDGAMYFCTGGRDLASGFYKLSYTGGLDHEIIKPEPNRKGAKERTLRKKLEALHLKKDPSQLDFIIDQLDHKDRFVRFAARIALENQGIGNWRDKINGRTTFQQDVAFGLAIARLGEDADRSNALNKLLQNDYSKLSDSEKHDFIRVIQLALLRMDNDLPLPLQTQIVSTLKPFYLVDSEPINKELCMVLSYLQVADIIEPTLARMETDTVSSQQGYLSEEISKRSRRYGKAVQEMLANMPNQQNISYAKSLSEIKEGQWNEELRKRYFNWYSNALKKSGGRSYAQFIRTIQENALKNVPFEERQYFEALATEAMSEANDLLKGVVQPKGPGQNWTVDNTVSAYLKNIKTVDFESGKNLFKATLCASCHNVKGLGRNTGPDLTQVGTRFSLRDLATAIVLPSASISDRYQFTEFHLKDDRVVAGTILEEKKDDFILSTNAFSPELETVLKKKNILRQNEAGYSSMPPGLINRLNEKEVADLIAFLMSGGDSDNRIYRKNSL